MRKVSRGSYWIEKIKSCLGFRKLFEYLISCLIEGVGLKEMVFLKYCVEFLIW